MSRSIAGNRIAQDPAFVTQVSTGGTSATSIDEASAADALNYPLKSQIGLPFGLAPLDANGLLAANLIPVVILSRTGVQITGPLSLGIGLTGTYTIVNYVTVRTYTVFALAGTVSVTGDTITYTAPLTTGQSGFTVNGITTNVTIVDPAQSPIVTGPSSLMENQTGTYTVTNYDQFSTYTITTNQGAVSRTGNTITYTAPAGDGINNLGGGFLVNSASIAVQITPPPAPILTGPTSFQINTVQTFTITNYTPPGSYYVSVTGGTFTQSAGVITVTAGANTGNFALTVNTVQYAFTVVPPTISQPSILAPVNGASNLGPAVNFTTSAFASSLTGDTQAKSNWQLASDPGFTNMVQSSYNDATNLTTWTINNLPANSTYFVRVQYADIQNNLSQYSIASNFSTKANYTATGISSRIYIGWGGNFSTGSYATINGVVTIVTDENNSVTGLGFSVSISQSGTLAVLGGWNTFNIYELQAGIWTQMAPSFYPSAVGATGVISSGPLYGVNYGENYQNYYLSGFGRNTVLSSDGSTIITGCPLFNTTDAAVSVFSNNAGTWTFIGNITVAQSSQLYGYSFGRGLALSADGKTIAIVSATNLYIYSNISNTFTNIVNLPINTSPIQNQLALVSISSDGNTIATTVTRTSTNTPVDLYIFNKISGTWTQSYHGTTTSPVSMALNSNGSILAVGSSQASTVTIYQNQAGNLTVIGTITSPISQFGAAISLNSDGTILLVGSPTGNNIGAAFIYKNVAGTWTLTTTFNGTSATSYFGQTMCMTPDSSTILIGAPYELNNAGAVYVAT